MKHLTMSQLDELGFNIVKSYTHDNYMTQRRKKGLITVETTWLKSGKFISQDLTIDECFVDSFSISELKNLDEIINRKL